LADSKFSTLHPHIRKYPLFLLCVSLAFAQFGSVNQFIWTLKILNQPDNQNGTNFGRSVSLYGPYLLVGAPNYAVTYNGTVYYLGKVWLYTMNSNGLWSYSEISLTNVNEGRELYFGNSMSMSATMAIVGAPDYYQNGGG